MAIFLDVESLLDTISRASRMDLDLLEIADRNRREARFDLFLCHNSDDKTQIRNINTTLKRLGVRTWFDEEQIQPGMIWQIELEKIISKIESVAVFVGANGFAPRHGAEIRAFLSEFMNRGCLVIPVRMESSMITPDLPVFMRQMQWVDLFPNEEGALRRIAGVIKAR